MFILPDLPYRPDALEPVISAETLRFHHGKHHRTYVETLNALLAESGETPDSLEAVVRDAAGDPARRKLFNNAAQAWNHTVYWHSMTPKGGGKPAAKLAAAIDKDFGSFDAFAKEFTEAATTQFGSGWAWLVVDGGKLKVMKTGNAETPLATGKTPLITIDVWEHAYYLDYQNKRPDYVKAWLEKVVNWEFAAENFTSAK